MSAVTDRLYKIAQQINSKQLNTELGFMPVFTMITPLAVMYTLAALTGQSILKDCADDKLSNKETIQKFLTHTLTIAITVPVTLLFSKIVQKDAAGYIVAYGIMSLVGTALIANAMQKCGNSDDTQKFYNGVYMAIAAVCIFLGSFFLAFV